MLGALIGYHILKQILKVWKNHCQKMIWKNFSEALGKIKPNLEQAMYEYQINEEIKKQETLRQLAEVRQAERLVRTAALATAVRKFRINNHKLRAIIAINKKITRRESREYRDNLRLEAIINERYLELWTRFVLRPFQKSAKKFLKSFKPVAPKTIEAPKIVEEKLETDVPTKLDLEKSQRDLIWSQKNPCFRSFLYRNIINNFDGNLDLVRVGYRDMGLEVSPFAGPFEVSFSSIQRQTMIRGPKLLAMNNFTFEKGLQKWSKCTGLLFKAPGIVFQIKAWPVGKLDSATGWSYHMYKATPRKPNRIYTVHIDTEHKKLSLGLFDPKLWVGEPLMLPLQFGIPVYNKAWTPIISEQKPIHRIGDIITTDRAVIAAASNLSVFAPEFIPRSYSCGECDFETLDENDLEELEGRYICELCYNHHALMMGEQDSEGGMLEPDEQLFIEQAINSQGNALATIEPNVVEAFDLDPARQGPIWSADTFLKGENGW